MQIKLGQSEDLQYDLQQIANKFRLDVERAAEAAAAKGDAAGVKAAQGKLGDLENDVFDISRKLRAAKATIASGRDYENVVQAIEYAQKKLAESKLKLSKLKIKKVAKKSSDREPAVTSILHQLSEARRAGGKVVQLAAEERARKSTDKETPMPTAQEIARALSDQRRTGKVSPLVVALSSKGPRKLADDPKKLEAEHQKLGAAINKADDRLAEVLEDFDMDEEGAAPSDAKNQQSAMMKLAAVYGKLAGDLEALHQRAKAAKASPDLLKRIKGNLDNAKSGERECTKDAKSMDKVIAKLQKSLDAETRKNADGARGSRKLADADDALQELGAALISVRGAISVVEEAAKAKKPDKVDYANKTAAKAQKQLSQAVRSADSVLRDGKNPTLFKKREEALMADSQLRKALMALSRKDWK